MATASVGGPTGIDQALHTGAPRPHCTRSSAWPAIDRWTLIDDTAAGGRHTRVYRAHHGAVPVRWTFKLDASDLITDVDPQAD